MLLDFFFFLEGEALGGAEGVRGRFSGCFPCAFSDMAGAAGGVEGRVGLPTRQAAPWVLLCPMVE